MNTRLKILFSCLLVVTILVVLIFTVFIVRKVDVVIAGENHEINSSKIIEDSKLSKGMNILTISERKAIANIELNNTDIKVINIEKRFPSKVVIHVAKRIPIFSIKLANSSNVLILDSSFLVMDIVEESSEKLKNLTKILGANIENETSDRSIIGKTIDLSNSKIDLLNMIEKGFAKVGFVNEKLCKFIPQIDLRSDNVTVIKLETGGQIELIGNTYIDNQITASYNLYNSLSEQEKQTCVIYNDGSGWKVK